MKKILKGLVMAVVLLFSASAFAGELDFSTFWKEYGAGYEAGQMYIGGDIGISPYTFADHGSGDWYGIPQISADFDMIFPITVSDITLPLSFGGCIDLNMFGAKDPSLFYSVFTIDGVAKYHVSVAKIMPDVEILQKLDVYSGLKMGVAFALTNNTYAKNKFGVNLAWLLGADYFITDKLAATLEFGLAPYLKAGARYRLN